VERQVPVAVAYKGAELHCQIRIDVLVEACVIMEIKAVDELAPIHRAQLLTYLKLAGCSVGLLLNFNSVLLKHGMRRILNG
jgi:GxxExxY protein